MLHSNWFETLYFVFSIQKVNTKELWALYLAYKSTNDNQILTDILKYLKEAFLTSKMEIFGAQIAPKAYKVKACKVLN